MREKMVSFEDSDMFECALSELQCSDRLGFSFWMIFHIAPLFGFDSRGHYDISNMRVKTTYPTKCSLLAVQPFFLPL